MRRIYYCTNSHWDPGNSTTSGGRGHSLKKRERVVSITMQFFDGYNNDIDWERCTYLTARQSTAHEHGLGYYDDIDDAWLVCLWFVVDGSWMMVPSVSIRRRKYVHGYKMVGGNYRRIQLTKRWTQRVTALPPIWRFRTQNTRITVISTVIAVIYR